jgi:DNA-binding NarL/FixJ family response regulator
MRVLVVDDHSLFRDGIISLLEAAGFVPVGQVGDGYAAVEAALRLRPDLVLMDIHMPGMTSVEALRLIKQALPETRVVMLSVSDNDADLLQAFGAGADGYLLKSLNASEFLDMLNGLQRGEAAISRRTAAALIRGINDRVPSRAETLTQAEIRLLASVAKGMSNKAIAQSLSVSQNTVKYHLKNILRKLGAQNRTEAVTQAINAGLLRPPSSV